MKNIFLLCLITNFSFAQCISGDCKNGFGKYDYGFAVYEGNFKSEKPSGKGTMDYGNGEKFVGNFIDGQETGDGVLYKKNIPQNVTYTNGKLKISENRVVIGSNAPTVKGCIQGDCYKGFGIIKFNSGNSYEGNFDYGIKSGNGKFIFTSGNFFTGTFKDNKYSYGIFNFIQGNMTFEGSFNDDGSPKTGKYYYPTNKATVLVENGNITKVDNPVADEAKRLAEENSKPKMCMKCGGTGMCAGEMQMVQHEDYVPIHYVDSSGSLRDIQFGNVMKSVSYETSFPTKCTACNGTGQLINKGMIINTGRY